MRRLRAICLPIRRCWCTHSHMAQGGLLAHVHALSVLRSTSVIVVVGPSGAAASFEII